MKISGVLATAFYIVFLSFASAAVADDVDIKDFIGSAAKLNFAEIEIGKVALEQTKSSEIRAYARKMIEAHASSNKELRIIAAKKKVDMQNEESLDTKAKSFILAQREGEPFDEAYINNQIKSHTNAIALYTEGSTSDDADVRLFSVTGLPILQHHLEMIKQLAETHKPQPMNDSTQSSTAK